MIRNPLRALALAFALAATPACAALHTPKFENPISAAKTADQKAYALLESYAAVLEEATDLVRDPALPVAAKRALIAAEAVATSAAETLRIAFVGYLRARADYQAIANDRPKAERAAAAFAIAAMRLDEAITAARGPFAAFAALAHKS